MADAIPVHSKKIEPTQAEQALEAQAIANAKADAARPAIIVDPKNQKDNGHGKHEMSQGVQKILQEAAAVTREPVSRVDMGNGTIREDW